MRRLQPLRALPLRIRLHQRDELCLGLIAAAVAITAFLFYFRHNALLLYGDAVAHINIARRVFDSRDPGPLQLGTVWLPLPHVLILPFVISRWMWRTGVAGAIPSMVAYVAGAVGMFRLVRRGLNVANSRPLPLANSRLAANAWNTQGGIARIAAWFAALIYIANPNLIYLQTTAMTEPLYLALFIWATVFFVEFVTREEEVRAVWSLRHCGIALLLVMLTRYDGWFAGVVFGIAAAVVYAHGGTAKEAQASGAFGFSFLPLLRLERPLRNFVLLLVAVPVLWLVYNAAAWGNPLEFATGPYSAKAIEVRSATPTMLHYPGYHNLKDATLYFLKAAKLNIAARRWESPWLWLVLAATALVLLFARRLWPLLLLWTPLPFYALSISRGGVPIFFPDWWPHSYYNVRYGLELLPALAVFSAVVLYFALGIARKLPWRVALLAAALLFVIASYASVWRTVPICLREARANSLSRIPFERELANELRRLPQTATVLMFFGEHGGALQMADMPLRRTINETTHPFWRQALADPAGHAEYAVAFDDDAVAQAVGAEKSRFAIAAVVQWPGQKTATIYRRVP